MKTYHDFIISESAEIMPDHQRYQFDVNGPDWDHDQQHKYDDEIKSAIYDYVAGYTTSVNNYLRDNKMNLCKPITDNMDKAFTSQYSDKGIIDVYRTVDSDYMLNIHNFDGSDISQIIGQELVNKGYMSTSFELQSPWGKQWLDGDVIMHITSDRPISFIDINKVFDKSEIDCTEQHECLLPRNLKMAVTAAYIIKKRQDKRMSKSGNVMLELKII